MLDLVDVLRNRVLYFYLQDKVETEGKRVLHSADQLQSVVLKYIGTYTLDTSFDVEDKIVLNFDQQEVESVR